MKLDFKTYSDKVRGCYTGKNIGGTLGAPFECYRGVYMKRASGETVNFSGARLNAAYFMRLGEKPRRSL